MKKNDENRDIYKDSSHKFDNSVIKTFFCGNKIKKK